MKKISVLVACLLLLAGCGFNDSDSDDSKTVSKSVEANYAYDDQGRLVEVSYSNGAKIIYEYDASGNRTKKTIVE